MTVDRENHIEKSTNILYRALSADFWILPFSGGKDSSVLLDLTLSFLIEKRLKKKRPSLIITYNDTLLEWPPLRDWALKVMRSLKRLTENTGVDLRTFILKPEAGESFLEMVFKKRYPAPSPRFRWCTERLKVRPTLRIIRRLSSQGHNIIMLTGVRYNESKERSGRLKGRDVIKNNGGPFKGPGSVKAYAPLYSWTLNDIWTYIDSKRPVWNEPSWTFLVNLYGPKRLDYELRFGCFLCPLIKHDLSGKRLVEVAYINRDLYDELRKWVDLYIKISRSNPSKWRERKNTKPKRYKIPYGKLNDHALRILKERFCKILSEFPKSRELLYFQLERIPKLCNDYQST